MKFAYCEIPLFKRHVLVAMDCTVDEGIEKFRKHRDEHQVSTYLDLDVCGGLGWCQTFEGDVYVWVGKEEYSVLIHELVHAAFQLCNEIGMEQDEEMICRLVEHMKSEIIDKLETVESPA